MSQNKHLELLKSLVLRHPALFDPAQKLDEVGVIKDLRKAIGELNCPEIAEAFTVKRVPAVVKWIGPDRYEIGLAVGKDLIRAWRGIPKDLREGDAVELDVRRTWHGTLDVLAVRLPAQTLTAADAEAGV